MTLDKISALIQIILIGIVNIEQILLAKFNSIVGQILTNFPIQQKMLKNVSDLFQTVLSYSKYNKFAANFTPFLTR